MMIGRIAAGGGTDDLFHNGELLVGTQLLLDGGFPWRDFISTHGVLLDSFQSLPGLTLIDHSIWGACDGEVDLGGADLLDQLVRVRRVPLPAQPVAPRPVVRADRREPARGITGACSSRRPRSSSSTSGRCSTR